MRQTLAARVERLEQQTDPPDIIVIILRAGETEAEAAGRAAIEHRVRPNYRGFLFLSEKDAAVL